MLEIKNLTKSYGSKRAVDDLTLTLQKGEICGFIGHNGAGKTTTIKCCCGLLDFEGGEILLDGVSVKKDPIGCKKKIAYLPDNPDLYEFMSGIKYLNFICDVFGISKTDREARIRKYGNLFGMTENLGSPISSYSHGMKQKIAVISALCHDPEIMLCDEPFVGLDPSSAHAFKLAMREMCDKGASIFFSTHVLEVAEKLCDTIAIIKNGRLIAYGPTEQVKGDTSLESVFLELVDDNV